MNVEVKLVPVGEINGIKSVLKKSTLVAAKDFKAGETIYKEKPIVAALDADLIGTGEYCSYCLREMDKSTAIRVPLDPFESTYCSQECQHAADEQYQSLLFSTLKLATAANPSPTQTKVQVEERRNALEAFAAYIKENGKTASLMILRFVGQLLADEHQRLIGSTINLELPEVPKESKLAYSFYDYIERLRSIEVVSGPSEEAEMEHCRGLLKLALEGLEEFLDDEKYLTLKGKVAYNSFGVYYGAGRTHRPQPKGAPESHERTRTPHGTSHQIGSAFYRVSSYLNHSCAPSTRPSFESGTSELHLIATHDIKKGDELTVSYVGTKRRSHDKNAFDARKHRRMELARGWGFACACPRCESEALNMHLHEQNEAEVPLPTHEARLEPAVAKYLETP